MAAKQTQPRGLRKFYRETVAELRKVSWPTRAEAVHMTRVVLLVIAVMSAFLGLMDYLFTQLFGLILGA